MTGWHWARRPEITILAVGLVMADSRPPCSGGDVLAAFVREALAPGRKAWPPPQRSTGCPAVTHASPRHPLFPSALGFRRDRRNLDHCCACGCGAIHVRRTGRAYASVGAFVQAARPGAERDGDRAGDRALPPA